MKKPSVTQLVGMLDKPALMRWANKQGLLGIDVEKERARTKASGNSLHYQIERGEFIDPLHAASFSRFMADKVVVKAEGKIETEWFVGRYDCKIAYRGETWLADYKSGRGVYFETRLQLAAYSMAEPCDRLGVVHVPDFYLVDACVKDRSKYEDILIALSRIHSLRWEIENMAAWN